MRLCGHVKRSGMCPTCRITERNKPKKPTSTFIAEDPNKRYTGIIDRLRTDSRFKAVYDVAFRFGFVYKRDPEHRDGETIMSKWRAPYLRLIPGGGWICGTDSGRDAKELEHTLRGNKVAHYELKKCGACDAMNAPKNRQCWNCARPFAKEAK